MDIDPSMNSSSRSIKNGELGIRCSATPYGAIFAHARDELSDLQLLLPLKHGVTVIAAIWRHGRSEPGQFDRLLSILPAYPNFYAISRA